LTQQDAACTQAAALAQEATERVRAPRLAWISGTAGALAGELTEGEPCPVCGSTTHPSPATAGTDGATRQQVEAAEEQQRQADEALSGAVRERHACAARLQEAQRASDGMDVPAAKEALEAAATALATARAAADGVEELVERLEAFDAGTEQERAALDAARSAQESARSRLEADREALTQDQQRCLEARGTWPSVTARAAALLVRAKEAEDASQDVDTARTALAQARSALADLATALTEEGFTGAAQATAALMEHGRDGRATIAHDVAGLYVVGGGSELPIVARMLRNRYGRRVHRSPYTAGSTAIGLALAADPEAGYSLADQLSRGVGVFREGESGTLVTFDPLLSPELRVSPGKAVSLTRRYRAAHNLGRYRFVEYTRTEDGVPRGTVVPCGQVSFPFDPALRGAGVDLDGVDVRRTAEGALIEENYTVDAHGIVEVSIRDLDTGYATARSLGARGLGRGE